MRVVVGAAAITRILIKVNANKTCSIRFDHIHHIEASQAGSEIAHAIWSVDQLNELSYALVLSRRPFNI